MTNENTGNESGVAVSAVPVNIARPKDNAMGIVAFVFGAISIVILAPLFVPLSLLFTLIALLKRQFLFSFLALVCATIGFLTSPILLGLAGLATLNFLQ
ncbi:MAG TPA: hypothetical protein ENJ01_11150 [Gammaproteobacteria bacterium]|nr:hypothetical protein [Gammaproteobacteria bacterium]